MRRGKDTQCKIMDFLASDISKLYRKLITNSTSYALSLNNYAGGCSTDRTSSLEIN